MKKTLHFKTNTLLKNLVGKDLINDDKIAIVELVKNSYDADSRRVLVRFSNLSKNGTSTRESQITIADEGVGMDIDDIEDKWLNIAYSDKVLRRQRRGAYMAGNKGIGRFSCDRLGEELDLLTRKKGGALLHMRIHWPDFEVEGKKNLTIQTIDVEVKTIDDAKAARLADLKKFPRAGTVLVISGLRSSWDRGRLMDLKTSLEKFLNPNQLFLRERFRIDLSVPAFAKVDRGRNYSETINGEIQNQIFDKLKFNTTYIDCVIADDNKTLSTELFHEGEKVFTLVERNMAYPLLAGAHIVIYYLNPYKKAYFKRQTGVRSIDFGSVFLFLNGFRIAPYGDRGDDWLSLDSRKTQGIQRYLSSRDIVGRIEVSGSEAEFKPISSREGLKKTASFLQLRDVLFLDVLRKLEKFVIEGLQWDSVSPSLRQKLRDNEGLDWNRTPEVYSESWERKQQRIALSMMTLIGSTPDRIVKFWFNPALLEGVYESRQEEFRTLLGEIEGIDAGKVDRDLGRSLAKLKAAIVRKDAEAKAAKAEAADLRVEVTRRGAEIDDLQEQTETYRAQTLFLKQVTSFDVKQLMAYHHQISLDATIADNYIAKALKSLRKQAGTESAIDDLQKASLANKRIAAVAQFATKANFRSGTKKEPTDIPAFVEQYLLRVAKDFVAAGIELDVSNKVNEAFEVKMSRIELSILLDNIISNASKAHARRLEVEIQSIAPNSLGLSFSDDGDGLAKGLSEPEAMFDLGITTTSGSGFGLYHARQIVESVDGKIQAFPRRPKGMEIRIELVR